MTEWTKTALLSLSIVCLCIAAAADEPNAKQLFDRGTTAYALGRYGEAAELFEKSFERKQDPAILYNAAQAHRLAGHTQKALVLYRSYLQLFGTRENAAEVEQRIAELRAQLEAEPEPKVESPARAAPPVTAAAAARHLEPSATTTAGLVSRPVPARRTKSIASRGWFWGVLVGSAVVVGGAIALGVVLGTPRRPPDATLGSIPAN